MALPRPTTYANLLVGVTQLVDALEKRTSGRDLGLASVGWPGGAITSNVLTVGHNLGTTPRNIQATINDGTGLTAIPSVIARNYGSTSFEIVLTTVDGQLPANTVVTVVAWLATA